MNIMNTRKSKYFNLVNRGLNLLNHPSKVPLTIKNKLKQRFDNSFVDARYVAIKPGLFRNSEVKVAHLGVQGNSGNGGDTLLFVAVRQLFQKEVAPTNFTLLQVRDQVTEETIEKINQHDALIIGGGGLLLADTNQNSISGWQWACPTELLDKIKVPIIVFAIGYNRFRGQSEFADVFHKNVCKLVEKSSFFGLRNYGSIEALKEYLPVELHKKLVFQPCPTTLLNYFYPYSKPKNIEKSISVNIAFDRPHLRFGNQEDEILWNIAKILLSFQKKGWKIKLFNHIAKDKEARIWFNAQGLYPEEVNLFNVAPQVVIEEYSKVSLALGMRGHAQMIPFGLNVPILSLISHDKLGFFLDDIGHPEWGVEIKSPNFRNNLYDKLNLLTNELENTSDKISNAQERLWEVTQQNLQSIKTSLEKGKANK
jgi:polysaccharide pyruvyl transferase WcaK-like protein